MSFLPPTAAPAIAPTAVRASADADAQADAQADADIIGWDVGGAHVKAARWRRGRLHDVRQWPCPLWTGLDRLTEVMAQAATLWPDLTACRHAATMTGEMVDGFSDRADGVRRIARTLAACGAPARWYAGRDGWIDGAVLAEADGPAFAAAWRAVASANWRATAEHAAQALAQAAARRGEPPPAALLLDIGSTTTDLIALRDGQVPTDSVGDFDRLRRGELVYQGVVRTPLCALGPTLDWQGSPVNVMNEWFATTADVYRVTGELDDAHDQQPSADGQPKDRPHAVARLARMVGLDAADLGDAAAATSFAMQWRQRQVERIEADMRRVCERDLGGAATGILVAAGCGAFLAPALRPKGWRLVAHDALVPLDPAAPADAPWRRWVGVAAPAVAVAALLASSPSAVARHSA